MALHTRSPTAADSPIDSAGESTYRAIRRDIILGRLAPKARLRLERLRSSYGASVSTLREILNRLVGEAFVVGGAHCGFAVAPVTQREFRELASLRELLEGHAMHESFRRGDLEWEASVVGAHHKLDRIERMMLAGDRSQSELWKHCDKGFHQALISACGSSELLQAHAGIFDRYLRYQIVAMIFRGEAAAREHRDLLACALERDAGRATETLRRHISACVEHTLGTGSLDDPPAAHHDLMLQAYGGAA